MKNIQTIAHSHDIRVRVFWALTSISIASLGIYISAVLATIHHTVARESFLSASQTLTARVSELEYKDIAMRNTLSLDTALARGFSEVTKPLYVSRAKTVLTLNTVSR